MTKNSLGREIPDQFCGRPLRPYQDPFSFRPTGLTAPRAPPAGQSRSE